jgi:hypothetical protein
MGQKYRGNQKKLTSVKKRKASLLANVDLQTNIQGYLCYFELFSLAARPARANASDKKERHR